jgi:hypothetical protein
VFNVFVERSRGRFIFNDVDDIVNQNAFVEYRNTPSNNSADGAAAWGYDRYTAFAQSTWQVLDNLELTAGVRYENLSTGDTPTFDPTFAPAVGFDNTATIDGLDLVMPRLGFRYEPFDRTTITGGLGIFAGGDPAVWTSNAYQVPAVLARGDFSGVTGNSVPQALIDDVANGTALAIDAIDPNFEIPNDLKASLRIDQEFDMDFGAFNLGSGYLFSAQVLYTEAQKSFLWREAAQTNEQPYAQTGVAPDGRTIYADLNDLGVSNRTILTNGSGAESLVYTLSLQNDFDNGFGFFASYAHQDVEMVSEGSSSRGISSWRGQLTSDRNFPEARTSIYQVEHAFKLAFSYEREFYGDLTSRFDLFGQITSGSPYTYTFDISSSNALFGRAGNGESPYDNSPLYIPTLNDARVVYASDSVRDDFNAFIDERGLTRGQIADVHSESSRWNQRWDFRFQQDLPGIPGADRWVGDNRLKLVFDVENVMNMINDEWGTYASGISNGQAAIVSADLINASTGAVLSGDEPRTNCLAEGDCVYRYNSFNASRASTDNQSGSRSIWKARIGIRYEF